MRPSTSGSTSTVSTSTTSTTSRIGAAEPAGTGVTTLEAEAQPTAKPRVPPGVGVPSTGGGGLIGKVALSRSAPSEAQRHDREAQKAIIQTHTQVAALLQALSTPAAGLPDISAANQAMHKLNEAMGKIKDPKMMFLGRVEQNATEMTVEELRSLQQGIENLSKFVFDNKADPKACGPIARCDFAAIQLAVSKELVFKEDLQAAYDANLHAAVTALIHDEPAKALAAMKNANALAGDLAARLQRYEDTPDRDETKLRMQMMTPVWQRMGNDEKAQLQAALSTPTRAAHELTGAVDHLIQDRTSGYGQLGSELVHLSHCLGAFRYRLGVAPHEAQFEMKMTRLSAGVHGAILDGLGILIGPDGLANVRSGVAQPGAQQIVQDHMERALEKARVEVASFGSAPGHVRAGLMPILQSRHVTVGELPPDASARDKLAALETLLGGLEGMAPLKYLLDPSRAVRCAKAVSASPDTPIRTLEHTRGALTGGPDEEAFVRVRAGNDGVAIVECTVSKTQARMFQPYIPESNEPLEMLGLADRRPAGPPPAPVRLASGSAEYRFGYTLRNEEVNAVPLRFTYDLTAE